MHYCDLYRLKGVCTMGNMSVNVSIEGEGLDPIDPLLDPTMGNMSVNVSIEGEGLDPLDPLLDPTMGNMSVNVSMLYENKTKLCIGNQHVKVSVYFVVIYETKSANALRLVCMH